MIGVQNLTKTFDDETVRDRISFHVEDSTLI